MSHREDTKALTLQMITLSERIDAESDPKELARLERIHARMVAAMKARQQEKV